MAGSKKACLFAHIQTTLHADWTASLKNKTPCLQWTLWRRVSWDLLGRRQRKPLERKASACSMHKFANPWRIQTVLLYMVWHGSHQYTPFMLAYIAAPAGSIMGNGIPWFPCDVNGATGSIFCCQRSPRESKGSATGATGSCSPKWNMLG